ncbi:DoxX family protein [Phenylobacterium sp. 20VBR1]|uniref:DoxX family protein n=1 Tax=Phenylobacterium glaciei TaxID=2803784 RepID=A0A941HVN6_9CAUL|nr:DoxX family protein [Phenylobacterium glaciei]MBR7618918.1 DoxX family protein [Phenylobacterium glaciei]
MTIADRTTPKAMLWTGRVLTGLFAAFMLMDLTMKLLDLKVVADTMTQMGWPTDKARLLGALQLTGLALYLYPRTAVLGAVLVTGYLGGAIATHLRIDSPLFSHILFGVYLALFAWGGLWLRDARLRSLFPWRG